MFHKILVANRGEIAVRIIRACKQMGIKTVAIYSEADKNLLHVEIADEAFCVGPPPTGKSYLNVHNIMSAALVSESDAIHPGYGFLSENPHFAEICQSHHIHFIGPSPEAMAKLGDKAEARKIAESLGVPVIRGSEVLLAVADALKFAEKISYPVMIKAAAGGGGKGMRVACSPEELEKYFVVAQGEAESAFGDSRLYLEKFLMNPRHIEVQILADGFENAVAVGERECSLQRKHQKVMEEAPSIAVSPQTRNKIQEMAVRIAKAVDYLGAGTIEFLMDQPGNFFFIEANARIQVEHPVTEMVAGLDLVKEQICVASGQRLSVKQEDIRIQGHAVECRINAEDPETFSPSTGTVEKLHWPGGIGIRIDSHLREGDQILPFYDSLLGKIIAWGKDRKEAFSRMKAAIDECEITGIKTNLPFHRKLIENQAVQKGEMHVKLVEELFANKVLT